MFSIESMATGDAVQQPKYMTMAVSHHPYNHIFGYNEIQLQDGLRWYVTFLRLYNKCIKLRNIKVHTNITRIILLL